MTLDELIAVNDEVAALVRAGVPLDTGLAELGSDMPGRLGRFATALAERTAQGQPLDEAIMQDVEALPPTYRAVLEAGMRAGRLSAALEVVASAARRLTETRRSVFVAAAYPLSVLVVAWCGLAFLCGCIAPTLAIGFREFQAPGTRFLTLVAWFGREAWWWWAIVPALVVVLLALWWRSCTRVGFLDGDRSDRLLGWLPWTGRLLRWSRTETFLEILALLVESATPLPEAVTLAAEASGDPTTLAAARRLATRLRSGQTQAAPNESVFPPLLNWLLMATNREGALLPALRHSAAAYRHRVAYQAELMRMLLPTFLTITLAGTVVAFYAFTIFVPYTAMLRALGE